jgi:hypothetical protein
MRVLLAFVCAVALSSPALAQSAYVGASFIGDVIRVSGPDYGGSSGNGETFGAALRAGVPLGARWGVELEFARTGEVDAVPGAYLAQDSFVTSVIGGSTTIFPPMLPIPRFSSERRLSTISTVAWWNHDVNDRFSLAYLGGVAFTRADIEVEVDYDFPIPVPLPGGVPLPLPRPINIRSESVTYDADVVVGFEGRIGMTDHLRLVPGIRMQTAVGGWAIRPGVGLQWMF